LSHPVVERDKLPSLAGVAPVTPGSATTNRCAAIASVPGSGKEGRASDVPWADGVDAHSLVGGEVCVTEADTEFDGDPDAASTTDSLLAGVIALRRAGLCMRIVALARTGHRGAGVPEASGARYIAQVHARGAGAGDGVPRSTAPSRRADGAAHPSTMRIAQTAIRPTSGTVIGTP
jgi:hypothetical protein